MGTRHYRFTWGPPELKRAIKTRDPKHVTRAPRRRAAAVDTAAKEALQAPGAECTVFRRHDADRGVFVSWYKLEEPVPASSMVGRTTFKHVVLEYDKKSASQCAQFCIPASEVPEIQQTTRYIKVEEVRNNEAPTCAFGAAAFTVKSIATMPEAVYEGMLRGIKVPEDVLAMLNHAVATKGMQSHEADALWDAVEGGSSVCIRVK